MTLIYGFARRDLVIILGQAFSIFIYIRNLMFIAKDASGARQGSGDAPSVRKARRDNSPAARYRQAALGRLPQTRESLVEVALEIVEIFEPDMESQAVPAGRPLGRGPVFAQSKGTTRLSKPPHEKPMPKRARPSSIAASALSEHGFSTTEKSPDDP